jgi:hypothetical protein
VLGGTGRAPALDKGVDSHERLELRNCLWTARTEGRRNVRSQTPRINGTKAHLRHEAFSRSPQCRRSTGALRNSIFRNDQHSVRSSSVKGTE